MGLGLTLEHKAEGAVGSTVRSFRPGLKTSLDVGVSENWGVPYFGVLIIRILLFRVLY